MIVHYPFLEIMIILNLMHLGSNPVCKKGNNSKTLHYSASLSDHNENFNLAHVFSHFIYGPHSMLYFK